MSDKSLISHNFFFIYIRDIFNKPLSITAYLKSSALMQTTNKQTINPNFILNTPLNWGPNNQSH